MSTLPPSIAWPLVAAALLLPLSGRLDPRIVTWAGFVAALGTLLLSALVLAGTMPPANGIWLSDRLARSLPVLVAVPGVLVGAWQIALPSSASPSDARRRVQPGPAATQLLGAGAIIGCRAGSLVLMLVGIAMLLLAATLLSPGRSRTPVLFVSMLLVSWLGIAILSAGLAAPASWSALSAGFATVHPGLRVCGVLLLLLPMLLLAWQGPSRLADPGPTDASHERAGQALLPVLLAVPGLDIAIRLRALPEPDPRLLQLDIATLVGAGIVMMLLAVALLPGRARLADRLSLAAAVQIGAALVGIGVGDTGGLVAALMILFFLALAVPVSLLPAGPGPGSWMRRLAVLALAGLPPFGPFAAIFLLLLRVFGDAPVLALLVLASCVAVALSLLPVLRQSDTGGAAVRATPLALLPSLVALVLLGWLGLAMPDRVSNWLLDLSETAAGTTWPMSGPVSGPVSGPNR